MKVTERWHSERMGRDISLVRWGHYGVPVLLFPTAGGDAEEVERHRLVGTLAALGVAAWFAATAAAYDCYDAVFGRRAMAYRDKLAYLSRHRARTLGLGLAVAGLLLVPGVNLLALAIGSAGATLADHAIQRDARR